MFALGIKQHLKWLDVKDEVIVEVYDTLSSTNDYFKGRPSQQEFEFCFAENQTKGRGRLGRSWHSPAGVNLMFSCRWCLPLPLYELGGLSSCVSLSLISALNYLKIPRLMCKWPNDLFYQDKKLAGILIELYAHKGKISEAIIGIGLNVNMNAMDVTIEKAWTSLKNILQASQDREFLAAKIIQSLLTYLKRFEKKGWGDFLNEWAKYDYLKEQGVSIPLNNHHVNGIAKGVDISGALLVDTPENGLVTCSSGEVHFSTFNTF